MQESIDPTRLGHNRTGMQASAKQSKMMIENVDALLAGPEGAAAESLALAESRRDYIREADPLGSMPAPKTIKGMLKSGVEMMSGDRPQAFLDKLGERLAFERGGTRLYDAVLVKYEAHDDELQEVTLADVQAIREEEAEHALLLQECIEMLGADPTAQTPSADLVGVETMGLLQVVTDPRTTLAQTLHAALAAELVDNAGWETLIIMAEHMGQDEMAERFRQALQQENEHLQKVRSWYETLTLETGSLM